MIGELPKAVLDEFPEIIQLWQHKSGKTMTPFVRKAKERLLAAGVQEQRIAFKESNASLRVAEDILEAARASNADTLVMGQRGYSNVKEYAMGSVTRKVLNQIADMALCIVP